MNRFADRAWTSLRPRAADHTTGVAFVAYFGDGSRKFIFHWREAAPGQLAPDYVQPAYIAGAAWLHLTGCNLVCRRAWDGGLLSCAGLRVARRKGELRPQHPPRGVERRRRSAAGCARSPRADVILPSVGEAAMLTGAANDEAGCRQLAALGKVVVQKLGKGGCRVFADGQEFAMSGFDVPEIDPTGARRHLLCRVHGCPCSTAWTCRRPAVFAATRSGALAVTW